MKRIIGLYLCLLVFTPVFAQERTWTLDDCIRYAVENNQKTIQQGARLEIYQADRLQAIGNFIPTLNAGVSGSFRFGRQNDNETNAFINTTTLDNSYGLSSSLTLFDGLSSVYRYKMANVNRDKGRDEIKNIQDQVALETIELFFNVRYYLGTVRLAEQQLKESEANLRRIERMEELGLKAAPDVAEIQAKASEDRFLLTQQKNALAIELIRLKDKMNFPVEEELRLADFTDLSPIAGTTRSAADIYTRTLEVLPQALISEKSLKASEMQYKMIKGQLSPTLSLNANLSTFYAEMKGAENTLSFRDQLDGRRSSSVSIHLSIPLLDGFSRQSNVKRGKQQWIIAQSQYEEALRTIYTEIEQTLADVNGLADEYAFAVKRTESMTKAHQVNQRKYEEGLISALELNTSSNRLLNAQIQELYTLLNYQVKYRLLEYYTNGQL